MSELVTTTPAPDMHFCYGCGKTIHVSALACPHCGARQDRALATVEVKRAPAQGREVFCRACGHAINAAAPLCPACGAPQAAFTPGSSDKSRVAAALLAFFLGGIGVHKFYLGQTGLGILYLLFCWTFIPAIIAFIEAIVYLCTSDANFARKYG